MHPSRQAPGQPGSLQRGTAGPLYLPLWSLGLTLLIALILAASVVLALVTMRGGEALPQAKPVIQVVAANPAKLSDANLNEADAGIPAAASGEAELVMARQATADLVMEGPTLPTIAFVPTPVAITVGAAVEVAGVGEQELNIRNRPGLTGSQILFRAPEGSPFDITGGPQEADGFSWWKLRDRQFKLEGWAVANYLHVSP